MYIKSFVTSAIFSLVAATSVSAATINNFTGLAAPVKTITFSEHSDVAIGATITNQYAADGVTFGSLSLTEGLYYTAAGNTGTGLLNYFPDTYNPFSIKFASAVTGAAFNMITNGYTDKFTALLNGKVIKSFTADTGNWKYYGFDGISFDEIQVEIGFESTALNKHMRLDDVQIGNVSAVPLPAGGLLLLSAFGGVAALKRRTKRKN